MSRRDESGENEGSRTRMNRGRFSREFADRAPDLRLWCEPARRRAATPTLAMVFGRPRPLSRARAIDGRRGFSPRRRCTALARMLQRAPAPRSRSRGVVRVHLSRRARRPSLGMDASTRRAPPSASALGATSRLRRSREGEVDAHPLRGRARAPAAAARCTTRPSRCSRARRGQVRRRRRRRGRWPATPSSPRSRPSIEAVARRGRSPACGKIPTELLARRVAHRARARPRVPVACGAQPTVPRRVTRWHPAGHN